METRFRFDSEIIETVLSGYVLSPHGVHGMGHWARVLETGLRLAEVTGADPSVVVFFALLHDARRVNDGRDPGHGRRGAELAAAVGAPKLGLSDPQLELLTAACERHTDGLTEGDVTVLTCWDADRLDLWRVSITPDDRYLCTRAARNEILKRWARERSLSGYVPDFVSAYWIR
ncbi:MAG: HD domain-containing protein [Candidatus Eisenbacteria bacterium]|nr:HD domain-containing protein [Candidatus Eisenbacteria bacterium]